MSLGRTRSLVDRLRDALPVDADLPTLAAAVYAAVARHVPYDLACFAATDPACGVITWNSKSRPIPLGDEEWADIEFGGPDLNSFSEIAQRRPAVGVLSLDTGGHPELSRRHRDYMAPRFGFTDELRAACLSRSATWGAIALYRGADDPSFTAEEAGEVADASGLVAEAIQRSVFRLAPSPLPDPREAPGPAVMIVDAASRAAQITPGAQAAVDELGGLDHGELPASLLAAVASARRSGQHVETRIRTESDRWLTLRAALLRAAGDAAPQAVADVVVTIEETSRATLSRLALAAHGLTTREEEVAVLVLQGVDTRGIAHRLHLSPHTVQDHLKTIFDKTGVRSRRELTARLVL